MTISHHYASISGIKLHYVESSPEQPAGTLLFLHGFPEYWATWQAQLAHFGKSHRAIALDLLGYNLSDKPSDDSRYDIHNLLSLLSGFIESICPEETITLVAHDWGGALAWPLVAFYPHLFSKLAILNAAHPSTFTREVLFNPEQQQKSEYISALIKDDATELLSDDNFAYLKFTMLGQDLFESLSDAQREGYVNAWSQPGAIEGMLKYYRAMPLSKAARESGKVDKNKEKVPNIRIECPTLVLWGENDNAFSNSILDGLEQYVPKVTIKRFPKATHWLHHEFPEDVNMHLSQFINE